MEPTEDEVRKAFEDVSTDMTVYSRLKLDDFLLGFCMAKGMSAARAIRYVKENPVVEDGCT